MTSTLFFSVRNRVNSMENVKMLKSKTNQKLFALISIALLLSLVIVMNSASALISQNQISWFWNSDTNSAALAAGDVNGDGQTELVTVGYYFDGIRWVSQMHVWNSTNLTVEKVVTWYWGNNTQAVCLALGNLTGNVGLEIVTGGAYFDGTRWVAQLHIWNGTSLAVENAITWYWGSNTQISSVAVGDVNGDGKAEIVTGGSYFDGTKYVALMHVWNATNLAVEAYQSYAWGNNTYINTVALGNITGGVGLDIVTGGAYLDGTRYVAQLHIWNGTTLAVEKYITWYWGSNTDIASVAIANVTGGSSLAIVTGGSFNDGVRDNAQLFVWNTATPALTVQNEMNWALPAGTIITSVAVGNYTGGANLDIITGGSFNDGVRSNAQLVDFNGGTLAVKSGSSWFVTSNTTVNSVTLANVGGLGNRVIACGAFNDLTRSNAQLSIWT